MERMGYPPVRALVVDDEPDGRYVLVKLLQNLQCEATGCEDGQACLDMVRDLRPDLILLDLAMPGMDGFQVVERLRDLEIAPPLLVALSGYGDAKIVARCLEAGFHRHELKPIPIDRLTVLLDEARRLAPQPAA
jgi:CheY-like chemotaxis protein